MDTGILQKEKKALGVEIKESNGSVSIERSFNVESPVGYKGAVVGLPLENFIIKNLYLPDLSKKELSKTVELQMEFNIPNYKVDYNASYIAKESKSGFILQIIAAKKSLCDKKSKIIIPSLLGMYAFAVYKKLLIKDSNALLIHIDKEQCSIVTLKNNEIVFMRSVALDRVTNFSSTVKLSSQAVFLQLERQFIDINKIVVFSADKKDKDLIVNSVDNNEEVVWVDIAEYTSKEKGDLFLSTGLALFKKQYKSMMGWSISEKPLGARDSIKRMLIFTVPLIIIFLPIYYYGQYYAKSLEISRIQHTINKFSDQLGGFSDFENQASQEKAYMEAIGNPSLNFARVDELFKVINLCRSRTLWLTSISGKVDDVIVISGFAQSYADITSFIKNLEASTFIRNINLNYTSESSGRNVGFQMTFELDKGYDFILRPDSEIKQKIISNKATKVKTIKADKMIDAKQTPKAAKSKIKKAVKK